MPDLRGAASVTLDTIIAPLLLQLIKDWPDNESDAEFSERSARAVTDALLAKGELIERRIGVVAVLPEIPVKRERGLFIPLEAS